MKNLLKTSTLLFLSILFFASCSNDGENDDATIKVAIKMNTKSTTTARSMTNNSLEFNSGSVIIREIVFDGDKISGGSVSITHEQISTINLTTGVASPAMEVVIPVGEYRSVNLGIEIQDENSIPSIIAEGIYTDNDGTEIPIKFEFNSGEVFEANAPSYTFSTNSYAIAEIDFSPADWFSTITSSMLDNAVKIDNIILVNENTNSNIFDIVADKLDDATQAVFN